MLSPARRKTDSSKKVRFDFTLDAFPWSFMCFSCLCDLLVSLRRIHLYLLYSLYLRIPVIYRCAFDRLPCTNFFLKGSAWHSGLCRSK